jgi:hypothetical protein
MVGDYVPLYFEPRSPMSFRIQHGGVDGVSPDPDRIVYLVSSTEAVLEAGQAYVYTDGNAAAALTEFHDDANLLDKVVDWPLMRAIQWANTTEDPDRRRRRGPSSSSTRRCRSSSTGSESCNNVCDAARGRRHSGPTPAS